MKYWCITCFFFHFQASKLLRRWSPACTWASSPDRSACLTPFSSAVEMQNDAVIFSSTLSWLSFNYLVTFLFDINKVVKLFSRFWSTWFGKVWSSRTSKRWRVSTNGAASTPDTSLRSSPTRWATSPELAPSSRWAKSGQRLVWDFD